MNNIYFTADPHFGHINILKHCSERPCAADGLIKEHDQWLLDDYNTRSSDLRFDVGIDGTLSRQLPGGFGFPTIEQIYEGALAKA